MLPAIFGAAALAAWAGVPPRPVWNHHRHLPLQLNFLDDYKAEQNGENLRWTVTAVDPDAMQFIGEVNWEHMEELRQVARAKGTEDGVDWTTEELTSVEVTAVDDQGILLQQVLCSAADQRCIAVDVPIPWPENMPSRELPEMRRAFTEISRRAYAAALGNEGALHPKHQQQQAELDGLMSLMNAEFGKLLRFYALKHARDALSEGEQVEEAKMTQLTYEGLSLELTTLGIGPYSLDLGYTFTRQTWSTSILFAHRCESAEQVEDMLMYMFDNTAAAVEQGRINVEGVAPEAHAETIAYAQKEQDGWQEPDVVASFRARDSRLRRAVRARRIAVSNQATARYIAASRQWSSTSSAGD